MLKRIIVLMFWVITISLLASCSKDNSLADEYEQALLDAKIQPKHIDYINVHGTSTPLGDISEMKAIHNVFQDDIYKLKSRQELSSVLCKEDNQTIEDDIFDYTMPHEENSSDEDKHELTMPPSESSSEEDDTLSYFAKLANES